MVVVKEEKIPLWCELLFEKEDKKTAILFISLSSQLSIFCVCCYAVVGFVPLMCYYNISCIVKTRSKKSLDIRSLDMIQYQRHERKRKKQLLSKERQRRRNSEGKTEKKKKKKKKQKEDVIAFLLMMHNEGIYNRRVGLPLWS